MKPNCYDCQHRRDLPGDAHSRCVHPTIGKQDSNEFAALSQMLSGHFGDAANQLHITAHGHGMRSGWFMWPVNFDPVWLATCDGFTPPDRSLNPPFAVPAESQP